MCQIVKRESKWKWKTLIWRLLQSTAKKKCLSYRIPLSDYLVYKIEFMTCVFLYFKFDEITYYFFIKCEMIKKIKIKY